MIKIRQGTFETNSSSTHSIVICNQEEYDKLQKNELFVKTYSGEIVKKERVVDDILNYLYKNVNTNDFLKTISDILGRDIIEIDKEVIMSFDNTEFAEFLREIYLWFDCDYKTLDDWLEDEYLESEHHSREFDNGTIHTFCKYGYDG